MIDVVMYPSVNPACNIDTTMYPIGQGGYTGSINLLVTGGTQPYSFAVLFNGVPFTTQQFIFNGSQWILSYLQAGTYTITVTDSTTPTPQTTTVTTTLTQPNPILANPFINAPNCNGGNDGGIILSPSGGTAPYTYLWNDSSTGDTITGAAGNYSVVITDHHGCAASFNFVIPVTPPQPLEIQQQFTNGEAILTALYTCFMGTVLWSTGETTASIIGQIGQTYTVTLSCPVGAGGHCTITSSVSITTTDDSNWCCLVNLLDEKVTDELNGIQEDCDCGCSNNDIILYYLIQMAETFGDGCLTQAQEDCLTSQINSMCGCMDC